MHFTIAWGLDPGDPTDPVTVTFANGATHTFDFEHAVFAVDLAAFTSAAPAPAPAPDLAAVQAAIDHAEEDLEHVEELIATPAPPPPSPPPTTITRRRR